MSAEDRRKSEVWEEFFEVHFADADTDSGLISDGPGRSGNVPLRLDKERIEGMCNSFGVPHEHLLTSAFAYVLSRFNGRSDSVFSYDFSKSGSQDALVPVRVDCSDVAIAEFVRQVSWTLRDLEGMIPFPVDEMLKRYSLKRDTAICFSEGTGGQDLSERYPHADIVLQIVSRSKGLEANFHHSQAFSDGYVSSIARSFGMILEGFAACSRLSEIGYVSEDDVAYQDALNDTDDINIIRNLFKTYDERVSETPQKRFVSCEGRSYTYGDIDALSNKVAIEISEKGLGNGDSIGILVPRSEWYIPAIIGVLKTGAAYVPLNDEYADDRLFFMIDDANVKAVIVTDATEGRARRICDADTIRVGEATEYKPQTTEYDYEDTVVILYTSGSTGTPKGCRISLINLLNMAGNYIKTSGFDENDTYGVYASIGFDAPLIGIFSTLLAGGAIDIVPNDIRLDIERLNEYFVRKNITHTLITTQLGKIFVSNVEETSLKVLLVGGEKLGSVKIPSSYRLIDAYGPTETTVYVTQIDVSDKISPDSVGRPNLNIRAYILDREKRRLPTGAVGELHVTGFQLMSGYINETNNYSAYIRNPWNRTGNKGFDWIYSTGDYFRILPDGTLGIVGRRDGQVKIRGNRIELIEVDAVIREIDWVKDVTVQTIETDTGGKELCAYIVTEIELTANEQSKAIREYVGKRKPQYMVPTYVIVLDNIPLNINGKVDRHSLPKPSFGSRSNGREPKNETESKLCGIFADVLGAEKIYADDSFFDRGGTSLLGVKLVTKCSLAGYDVRYKDVFDNPSPESLASFLDSSGTEQCDDAGRDNADETYISHNVISKIDGIGTTLPKNVLLTGSTGFLGAHILRELLVRGTDSVICVVRSSGTQSSEERIKTVFNYYFEGLVPYDLLSRVSVVDSDITDMKLGELLAGRDFDTIINSAAIVKHFASDDSIEKANLGGVDNLIGIAMTRRCRFVQISTESVAGVSTNGSADVLTEDRLDIGQNVDNKYIGSKFRAEKHIIDAMSKGLDAKIMRVGNLMGRSSDGEFQINFTTNAFVGSLNAYVRMGCFPRGELDRAVEFSQIDKVAEAVVLLSGTQPRFNVFHVNNCNHVRMADVMGALTDKGLGVEIVDDVAFKEATREMMSDDSKSDALMPIVAYLDEDKEIPVDCTYTVEALRRLGFNWPVATREYMGMMFANLDSLRFFRRGNAIHSTGYDKAPACHLMAKNG